MLRELRRRKQQVADKIGHEEYIYRLNGDPFSGQEEIRVRPQGDLSPRRAAAPAERGAPPFAVDDDYYRRGGGNGNGNNHNNRAAVGAALSPMANGQGAVAAGGGGGHGYGNDYDPSRGAMAAYPANANQQGHYESPYGSPGHRGGNGGGYMMQPQPVVTSFAPLLPALNPPSELPNPLPPVYRPKPPISFHSNYPNSNGSPAPPPPYFYPEGGAPSSGWPAVPLGGAGNETNNARPHTSPTVLPPLSGGGGGGANAYVVPQPMRSPRPSTGGNIIVGSEGLSDVEERHREKMAARQRAIELQQENARQVLEQQQRKQAERNRQAQEDRAAEDRLRREQEEVARRGQAEVDKESREREQKITGPQSAQAVLMQHQKETEQRREAEAAARRNRGRHPTPEIPEAKELAETATAAAAARPSAAAAVEQNGASTTSSAPPNQDTVLRAAPGPEARGPLTFTSSLRPSSAGAGPAFPLSPSPPSNNPFGAPPSWMYPPSTMAASPPSSAYHVPYLNFQQQQRQQHMQLETDVIHEELRHISVMLEAQQLNAGRTNASSSPTLPPWMRGNVGGPQPSSTGGAGTYLTTGLPSPAGGGGARSPYSYQSSPAPSGSASAEARSSCAADPNAPAYRPFTAGGTMPPPPLATATGSSLPQQPPPQLPPFLSSPYMANETAGRGAGTTAAAAGMGPWQGLFSAATKRDCAPDLSHSNSHSSVRTGGNGGLGINNDPEELSTEPSQFIMPAAAPPPPFVPSFSTPTPHTGDAPATASIAPSSNRHHHHENGEAAPQREQREGEGKDSPPHAQPTERPSTGTPTDSRKSFLAADGTAETVATPKKTDGVPPGREEDALAATLAATEVEAAAPPSRKQTEDSPTKKKTKESITAAAKPPETLDLFLSAIDEGVETESDEEQAKEATKKAEASEPQRTEKEQRALLSVASASVIATPRPSTTSSREPPVAVLTVQAEERSRSTTTSSL